MERVILKVEVDDALADAIVLSRVLNNGLQEVGLEVKNVSIVFQPFRSNSWDGVILLRRAAGHTCESRRSASLH